MDEHCRKALQYLAGNAAGTFQNGSCRIKNGDVTEVELLDSYSRAVITVVDTVGPAVLMVSRRSGRYWMSHLSRRFAEKKGMGKGCMKRLLTGIPLYHPIFTESLYGL